MEKLKGGSPDKKKLIIVGALVVIVAGVGVFQFTQGGSSPAPRKKESAVAESQSEPTGKTVADATGTNPNNPAVALTPKDPFKPIPLPKEETPQGKSTIIKAPPPMQQPPKVGYSGPPLPAGGGTQIGPMPTGGASVTASTPLRAPDEFTYVLVGIVSGPRPVAVFQDSSGSQKLVRMGEAVDEGSRVVTVTDDHVIVRHGKKNLTLTVGGRK